MDNDFRRHAPYTHFISNFGMLTCITAIPNYIDDCIKYFTIKICEYCKRLKNSEIWSHRLYTLGYLMKIYKNNERKKVGQALRMDRSYRICVKITTLLSLIFFFFLQSFALLFTHRPAKWPIDRYQISTKWRKNHAWNSVLENHVIFQHTYSRLRLNFSRVRHDSGQLMQQSREGI